MSKRSFSKEEIFPLIGKIIDETLRENSAINRDEIARKMLDSLECQQIVRNAAAIQNTDNLLDVAENMVDWFSAEITRNSDISLPWSLKYDRKRVKTGGRKIWAYSLADEMLPDEISEEFASSLFEGAKKQITVNSYERNHKARSECIKIYGAACRCCGFSFQEKYGDVGRNFIHVHHVRPIAEIRQEYTVNPREDLRPVCPNCHAMIHRKNPPFSIEEIKGMICGQQDE